MRDTTDSRTLALPEVPDCPSAGAPRGANEAVPSASGQRAGIPLTIDTKRLGDLWLPAYRDERDALAYMDKACTRALGKRSYEPLQRARMALLFQFEKTVETIHERGGLLLCVDA